MGIGIHSSIQVGAAIAGGTSKLVRHVADGLGRALDFDTILRGQVDGDRGVEPTIDLESLRQSSIDLIRSSLAAIGIGVNPPLRMDVDETGDVRVASDHWRAAEIELHLLTDVQVRQALERLSSAVGSTELTIGPATSEEIGPA